MQENKLKLDRIIKLVLVTVIVLSFLILSAFSAFVALSNTYNAVDVHMLDDLRHDIYTLLALIVYYYFQKPNDEVRKNDMLQDIENDRINNPCNGATHDRTP